MRCKHKDPKLVFVLGHQNNGVKILWCRECGSARFAKGVVGPFGPAAKWYRMKSPPKPTA
jgi:hypothetical protein